MIDTHAHLDFKDFDEDREEVISRAFDNGIKKIINIGVDLETSRKSVELAERHENIFATVGFHPEFFSKGDQGDWVDDLKKLAGSKKVVAVGEIGLDYFNHTDAPITEGQKENQKKGFVAQIEIAKELGLPAVVHCRDAWDDVYDIIKSERRISKFETNSKFKNLSFKKIPNTKYEIRDTKFVLHCYSSGKKDTEKFLQLPNVYFSFSGNITYPKPAGRANSFAEVIKMIPLDKIMLDSDAPFLAPQEFRGKRNEPAYVRYIIAKIAETKQISENKVEEATDINAEKFFDI